MACIHLVTFLSCFSGVGVVIPALIIQTLQNLGQGNRRVWEERNGTLSWIPSHAPPMPMAPLSFKVDPIQARPRWVLVQVLDYLDWNTVVSSCPFLFYKGEIVTYLTEGSYDLESLWLKFKASLELSPTNLQIKCPIIFPWNSFSIVIIINVIM